MGKSLKASFVHSYNPGKVTNSICCVCCVTVASSIDENELTKAEKAHRCPGFSLDRLLCGRQISQPRLRQQFPWL